jgi:hypothetical protein
MKKTFTNLICIILLVQAGFAQKDSTSDVTNNKILINLSGGVAFPVANFRIFENEYAPYIYQGGNIAGAASTGYYGKIELSYLFSKHFGVTAMIYSSNNKGVVLNRGEYTSPAASGLGGGSVITSSEHYTAAWRTSGALLGICEERNFNHIGFRIKFLAGLQQVKSPESQIRETGYYWVGGSTTGSFTNIQTQRELTAYAMTLNGGIDGYYHISKKIKLNIGIESFFSQPKFEGNLNYESTTEYTSGSTTYSESQKKLTFYKYVFLLGINAGISYVINE